MLVLKGTVWNTLQTVNSVQSNTGICGDGGTFSFYNSDFSRIVVTISSVL